MQLTPTAVARRHRAWFRLAAWAFTALAVIPTGLRPSKVLGAAKQTTAKNHDDEDDDDEEDTEDLARLRRSAVAVRASTAVSAYSDSDSVHVVSPTISGTIADDVAGWSVNGRYLVDAVSAASVDVVSTASGNWFEIRHVGSLAADIKTGPVGLMVAGGVSREPDYLSLGVGGTISLELMDKNFTPFIGVSYGHDDVGRTGMDKAFWQSMQKVGLQLGATFVVNRSTIASISGDLILERGYLAKPYRYVPLFAPGGGASVPPGASVDLVNQLRIDQRPADALPDARDRFAVSGRIAHRFDSSTIRFDQRLYRDSWGLTASTTDGRYTVDAGKRLSLGPHVRFHAQHGIDFWQRAYEATLVAGGTLAIPRYRTGDRELGPLKTVTAGAVARYLLNTDIHSPWVLSLQVEGIYTQFEDALYLKSRRALFANLSLDVGFE